MATSSPSMSMNKVIHGAVRRDLDRFRRALDSFTDGDRQRATELHRAWVNFDAQLTEHHEGEHELVWPALRTIGVAEANIESFESEHAALAAAMAQLQTTTVTHLDHEEQETEPTLAEHHGHAAIKEMARKFGRRASPPKAGIFFAWLQDGATPEEQTALRASVPGPVLAILGGLFGRRYRKDIAPVWSH